MSRGYGCLLPWSDAAFMPSPILASVSLPLFLALLIEHNVKKKFLKNLYLLLRERERAGEGREREGDKKSEANSTEPNMGLKLTDSAIMI